MIITAQLRLLEAILFAAAEPLTLQTIHERMNENAGSVDEVFALLQELRHTYEGRGVHLVEIDGAYSFRTAPDLAAQMQVYAHPRRKVPRVASEVLAIIAYHQPITRAEIEAIRGVATSPDSYDLLLELNWIKPGQRRDTPGRPMTWETTPEFLNHFNIASLNELPGLEELKAAGLLDRSAVLATMTVTADDDALPEGIDVANAPDPESNLVHEPAAA